MNLLFLTQTYPRFDGDTAGPFIRDLARALVAGGDSVTVLTPHATGVRAAWSDDGVEVRSFRYAPQRLELLGYSRSLSSDESIRPAVGLVAPLYALAARRAVTRLLSRKQVDLVHAHWVVPNGVVAGAGPRLAVPLAVGLHGSDVFLAERSTMRPLVARALGRTRLLTGCSPELVDRVCALGFPRARSRVIPYGVDPTLFSPAGERRHVWRRRLGIPETAVVVGGLGRMVTKKGFHVLLERVGEVLAACRQVHLVLGGAGDRLEELRLAAAPWSDRIHLPGIVMRDSIPDFYRALDIFVLPAVHDARGNVDGLPNVILEAMATGLPVVSTAISGIPLAIENGVHGLLVGEKEGGELVAALRSLVDSQELRSSMGLAARQRVLEELDWPTIAGRYREAYGETLGRGGSDQAHRRDAAGP